LELFIFIKKKTDPQFVYIKVPFSKRLDRVYIHYNSLLKLKNNLYERVVFYLENTNIMFSR